MERRTQQRLDIRLPLYYRRLDQGDFYRTECRNISMGGLTIALRNQQAIGQLIEARVLLPKQEVMDITGRIVWIENNEDPEAGIEIIDTDIHYRERIESLFENRLV